MTTENELTLTAMLTSSVQLTGLESGEVGIGRTTGADAASLRVLTLGI